MSQQKDRVNFSNFNYAYWSFQYQYKDTCELVSKADKNSFTRLNDNPIKIVIAMVKEYAVYVRNIDVKNYISKELRKIIYDCEDDKDYNKLNQTKNKTPNELVLQSQKFYFYLTKLFYIIGMFGDELSSTFMPTKSDRKKLFKYQNTNTFFEQFTNYKREVTKRIANFSIFTFNKNFPYFLGFYYAYYSYVDSETRERANESLSKILSVYLCEYTCTLILKGYNNLTPQEKKISRDIDSNLYFLISNVYSILNESYSKYGITPKIEEKIMFDYTLI